MILKSDIEVAQFQSNSPQYLPISEELWKALAKLPSVYVYAAYRKVLERFGTHYLSEGSLGGSFKIVTSLNAETVKHMGEDSQLFSHFMAGRNQRMVNLQAADRFNCLDFEKCLILMMEHVGNKVPFSSHSC